MGPQVSFFKPGWFKLVFNLIGLIPPLLVGGQSGLRIFSKAPFWVGEKLCGELLGRYSLKGRRILGGLLTLSEIHWARKWVGTLL